MKPIAWLALVGMTLGLAACRESAGASREWAAQDHVGEGRPGSAGQVADAPAGRDDEDATLVEVAWRQNCATCHGMTGRGDVAQGQMLRVPDLTRPELAQLTDDDLANVIRRGRNKMPGFELLPPRVVTGLARHVRKFGRPL